MKSVFLAVIVWPLFVHVLWREWRGSNNNSQKNRPSRWIHTKKHRNTSEVSPLYLFSRKKRTRLQRLSVSLCLEIRSRNDDAINSTRNRIYSLKVFTSYFIDVDTFYLFLNWFSTRVGDDRKYVCGRRLYACINTRKFKGLDSREITSLPEIKKVIYMARHFNHRRK